MLVEHAIQHLAPVLRVFERPSSIEDIIVRLLLSLTIVATAYRLIERYTAEPIKPRMQGIMGYYVFQAWLFGGCVFVLLSPLFFVNIGPVKTEPFFIWQIVATPIVGQIGLACGSFIGFPAALIAGVFHSVWIRLGWNYPFAAALATGLLAATLGGLFVIWLGLWEPERHDTSSDAQGELTRWTIGVVVGWYVSAVGSALYAAHRDERCYSVRGWGTS